IVLGMAQFTGLAQRPTARCSSLGADRARSSSDYRSEGVRRTRVSDRESRLDADDHSELEGQRYESHRVVRLRLDAGDFTRLELKVEAASWLSRKLALSIPPNPKALKNGDRLHFRPFGVWRNLSM